jgi:hypothetical protein
MDQPVLCQSRPSWEKSHRAAVDGRESMCCIMSRAFTARRSKGSSRSLSKSGLVVNVKKKGVIAIVLLSAALLGALGLRRNLADITSQVMSAGLSHALGISDVHVGRVEARGIRSITLADVRVGDAFSIERVVVYYDIGDIIRDRAGLGESITSVCAYGVDVDIAALKMPVSQQPGHSAGNGGPASGGRRRSVPGGFNGPIEIRDISISLPTSGGGLRELEAAGAKVEGSKREGRPVWKVALSDLIYRDGRSFEVESLGVIVDLHGEMMDICELEAELLGGSVSGGLVLRQIRSGLPRLSGNLDISGVSFEGLRISACVRMDEDGAVRARSNVTFPMTGGDGSVEAEYSGCLWVPGVVIGAAGETRTPARGGYTFEVDGVVRLIAVNVGQHKAGGVELDVNAGYDGRQVKATVAGENASMESIGRALGQAIPAEGWIDWKADLKIESLSVDAVVTINDGELKSELWPQEFEDLKGSIEIAQTMNETGGQAEIHVPSVRATMGSGEIEVSGGGQAWSVHGSELEIEHPLMRGFADVDATIRTSDRMRIEGTLRIYNALVDAATAAFSKATAIPDADLDLKVVVGDGVKAVREESWAQVTPSVVHIQGSVRQPRAKGYVEVGPGEVYLYGVPLEILSGRVDFSTSDDSPLEFSIVARDSSAEFPIMANVYGKPGDVHLSFAPGLDSDMEADLAPGDLLMKLLDARLRLYILSRIGRLMDSLPETIKH